ncbi:MAG: hypothetical protein AB7S38_37645 [Vulcanimicrobiota bacterium]
MKILISVHSPVNSLGLGEVLGPALGLATGYKPHEVTVVFQGDAVVTALRSGGKRYLTAAQALGVTLKLDEESLKAAGKSEGGLAAAAETISLDDYLKCWQESDLQLRL